MATEDHTEDGLIFMKHNNAGWFPDWRQTLVVWWGLGFPRLWSIYISVAVSLAGECLLTVCLLHYSINQFIDKPIDRSINQSKKLFHTLTIKYNIFKENLCRKGKVSFLLCPTLKKWTVNMSMQIHFFSFSFHRTKCPRLRFLLPRVSVIIVFNQNIPPPENVAYNRRNCCHC